MCVKLEWTQTFKANVVVDKVGFIATPHYVWREEGNHKELQRETSIEESIVIMQLGKDLVKMSISKLSFKSIYSI